MQNWWQTAHSVTLHYLFSHMKGKTGKDSKETEPPGALLRSKVLIPNCKQQDNPFQSLCTCYPFPVTHSFPNRQHPAWTVSIVLIQCQALGSSDALSKPHFQLQKPSVTPHHHQAVNHMGFWLPLAVQFPARNTTEEMSLLPIQISLHLQSSNMMLPSERKKHISTECWAPRSGYAEQPDVSKLQELRRIFQGRVYNNK